MALIYDDKPSRIKIDLSGPDGNAYVLLGYARDLGKAIGLNEEEIKKISSEMRESDYINLVETFDKYYGNYVDLILPPNWSFERECKDLDIEDIEVSVVITPNKIK